MAEIYNREVLKNGIRYHVHCDDGKDRRVGIYLNDMRQKYAVCPRISTWVYNLKNGKRFGRCFSVTDNAKIWGVGFLERITADLDATFPNGYSN